MEKEAVSGSEEDGSNPSPFLLPSFSSSVRHAAPDSPGARCALSCLTNALLAIEMWPDRRVSVAPSHGL